jgi:hypothetical protein
MRLKRCALALAVLLPLRGAAPHLAIEQPRATPTEDGASTRNEEFLAGDTVYLSFRLSGYEVQETDERQKIQLSYRVEVRDPSGVLVQEPSAGKVAAEISPEDKHWMPKVRCSVIVPAFAVSGQYPVSIEAVDELKGSKTSAEIRFTVRGRTLGTAGKLEILDFRFQRREDDREALRVAAYRPGDAVWARFDMLGYKLGEKNHLEVDYGVTVLRPTGEVLYSQATAAAEKTESFYPQRWVPGALSLKLDKDLEPARYTLIVTAHDRVGDQTCETRQSFDVE